MNRQTDRRAWLTDWARWTAAAAVGLGSAALMARGGRDCRQPCRVCALRQTCDPARQVQRRRQEESSQ